MNSSTFRAVSTGALAVLVLVTLATTALGTFLFIERRTHAIEQIVTEVRDDLVESREQGARTTRLIVRGLKLDIRRVRLAGLVETCTIIRLQGDQAPRCRELRAKVRSLARVIEAFRERLSERRVIISAGGGGGGGGDPPRTTRTTTATRTITTAPPKGCPQPNPKNPNC